MPTWGGFRVVGESSVPPAALFDRSPGHTWAWLSLPAPAGGPALVGALSLSSGWAGPGCMWLRASELPCRGPAPAFPASGVTALLASAGSVKTRVPTVCPWEASQRVKPLFPGLSGRQACPVAALWAASGHRGRRSPPCTRGGAASAGVHICIQALPWEKLRSRCRVLCLQIIPL